MVGLWAAAIPHLQQRLNLSADMLGMSIFCFGLGAVLATFVAPKYIERHQTRPVMIFGGCSMWLAFYIMLNMPTVATFMLMLSVLGFFCGILDTAMNSHAFTVEHHLQKPTLSLLHGGYSLGNVLGSAFAALVISMSASYNGAVLVLAVCAIGGLIFAQSHCYATDSHEGSDAAQTNTDSAKIPFALMVVAGLTAICFFAEGAIGDWSGIYLRDEKSANAAQTALSMGAFASGMTIARFFGDGLRARYAALPFLAASSGLACVMVLIFLVAPNATIALIALVIAGLGYANVVPLLFVRAANIEGISATRGVSFAAGMGYASLLGGPALLGYLAEHFNLFNAMFLVVLGSAILSLESWLKHKQTVNAKS